MPLGMEVGLGPGHTVLDGDPAPPPHKGHSASIFGPCLLWPNGWMDQDAIWYGGRLRPRNHVIDGVQIAHGTGNFGERGAHCKVQELSAVSCAKTAEPIDLPFGLWIRVGRRKHKFNSIRQRSPMFPPMANTIELSVWCGDANLCQITLTTCYYRGPVLLLRLRKLFFLPID